MPNWRRGTLRDRARKGFGGQVKASAWHLVAVVVTIAVLEPMGPGVAHGAGVVENPTIEVTTTDDVVDPNDGVVSLREAFDLANAAPGDDTIDLAADVTYAVSLDCAIPDDANVGGDLDHTDRTGALALDGAIGGSRDFYPRTTVQVDPSCPARAIHALGDGIVSLSGVVVEGGHPGADDAGGDGGGIRGAGGVSLGTSYVVSNQAAGRGGGIAAPVVRLGGSAVAYNAASGSGEGPVGGGIWGLDVEVGHSSVFANSTTAPGSLGGGVASPSTVRLSDATVSNNVAVGGGGGVVARRAEVEGSRVQGNRTTGLGAPGGGLLGWSTSEDNRGSVSLNWSGVFDNSAAGGGGGVAASSIGAWSSAVSQNHGVDLGGGPGPFSGGGGGIAAGFLNTDDLAVDRNTVVAAVAGGVAHGGGVRAGEARLTRASITRNEVEGPGIGGGVYASDVQAENTTVAENQVGQGGQGGGLAVTEPGYVSLRLSTITGNSAPAGANIGPAPYSDISASVIGEPRGGGRNCTGPTLDSDGYNVVGAGGGCGLHGRGDVRQVSDLQLGWLGRSLAWEIVALSRRPMGPVLSIVPAWRCPRTEDARGHERPRGRKCEAGAVEVL